jgi:hypothetical protein
VNFDWIKKSFDLIKNRNWAKEVNVNWIGKTAQPEKDPIEVLKEDYENLFINNYDNGNRTYGYIRGMFYKLIIGEEEYDNTIDKCFQRVDELAVKYCKNDQEINHKRVEHINSRLNKLRTDAKSKINEYNNKFGEYKDEKYPQALKTVSAWFILIDYMQDSYKLASNTNDTVKVNNSSVIPWDYQSIHTIPYYNIKEKKYTDALESFKEESKDGFSAATRGLEGACYDFLTDKMITVYKEVKGEFEQVKYLFYAENLAQINEAANDYTILRKIFFDHAEASIKELKSIRDEDGIPTEEKLTKMLSPWRKLEIIGNEVSGIVEQKIDDARHRYNPQYETTAPTITEEGLKNSLKIEVLEQKIKEREAREQKEQLVDSLTDSSSSSEFPKPPDYVWFPVL